MRAFACARCRAKRLSHATVQHEYCDAIEPLLEHELLLCIGNELDEKRLHHSAVAGRLPKVAAVQELIDAGDLDPG